MSDDFSGIDGDGPVSEHGEVHRAVRPPDPDGAVATFLDTTAWRSVLVVTALALCLAATWFAAYGWHRQLPATPQCDSRAYQPFLDSLQRSEDALTTALALSVVALVVAIGGLTQAVAVFKRGVFRWVLILTVAILGLPIEIALLVLKQAQAPNCF